MPAPRVRSRSLWPRLAGCAALPLSAAAVPSNVPAPAARPRATRPGYTTSNVRPALPDERTLDLARANSPAFVRDVIVSNTDPDLKRTDRFDDGECSIAIDPQNPQRIIISAFSGNSNGHEGLAPVFYSTDGGATWSKNYSVTEPPPGDNPIPFDQTFDYGRFGAVYGSLLSAIQGNGLKLNFWTGSSSDPSSSEAWRWYLEGGVAQATHHLSGFDAEDQPWLVVAPNPENLAEDNAYAAYNDARAFLAGENPDSDRGRDEREEEERDRPEVRARSASQTWVVRVAAAYNVAGGPPNFTQDSVVGLPPAEVHPGTRLAADPRTGALYAFYERSAGAIKTGDIYKIDYMLNRSVDGGRTWGLSGGTEGTSILRGANYQSTKLGGVNLPGNEHHGAVDPQNGDVYYALGDRDPRPPHRLWLKVLRLAVLADGSVAQRSLRIVTKKHVAMPQVAVAANGVVGVFYYTYDGTGGGYPKFSAHLDVSRDHGLTWTGIVLQSFLSAQRNNHDPLQRVLGDYQQLKVVGNTFYGAYTANGIKFGRPFANHDPIFYKLTVN